MPRAQHLFPTTVIGSLPRPQWLRDVILERKAGRLSEADTDAILDRAVESALILQEQAGLDEITDGEWRRESYVKVFAQRTRGFQDDLVVSGLPYPAAVAPIEYWRPIVAEEIPYVRARTDRAVKATLPSPYIIGRRMWHPDHSAAAYPQREDLMWACVPILQQEIRAIIAAGADTIQLDEPWLATLVDKDHRAKEGIEAVEREMALCADLLNAVLEAAADAETAVHLCHAHFDHQHGSSGAYHIIMPTLARIRVGTICMELATPAAGGIEALAEFPEHARLGLGCVDHCDREIETTEQVVARVEAAMRYVDKERITLHPDCGFAPSVQNPIDVDEAYRKLQSMCAAAAVLRERHPG
jgi:5-methyltetrahydropteroyltriglutamate--homocysteine methyltransferase